MTLGVFSIMYLILVILMTRSFLNEVYLIIISYVVLASFFGIEVGADVFIIFLIFDDEEKAKLINSQIFPHIPFHGHSAECKF